ncbi:MAG: prepilin peptidase [Acidobacteriota bacterium]
MPELVLAFLAGLLIGSFLNVCIFRLPRDLSVASPARSFCPGCETTIAWYDNIPLLSYLLLGGKCRVCRERIPLRYPIVELVTGVAFTYAAAKYGLTLPALKYCIFFAILIDLVATDIEERILPDEFTLGGTLVGLVLAWIVPLDPDIAALIFAINGATPDPRWISVTEAALGAGFSSGMIWFVAWVYEKVRHREGMGFGDVKMMAMIGAFLGLKLVLLTLILASLLSVACGPFYALLAKGRLRRRLSRFLYRGESKPKRIRATVAVITRYQLPFGSFLGVTAVIVSQWGSQIGDWYMRLGT